MARHRHIKVNNVKMIQQAFVHSSYAHEHKSKNDNERLEFMGDAVLQLWSSNAILSIKPKRRSYDTFTCTTCL